MNLKVLGYAFIVGALLVAGISRNMSASYLTAEFILILVGSALSVYADFVSKN